MLVYTKHIEYKHIYTKTLYLKTIFPLNKWGLAFCYIQLLIALNTIFLSKLKAFVWKCTKGQLIHWQYKRTFNDRHAVEGFLSSEDTIDYIIEHKCSISRFGDGEFQMIEHGLNGSDEAHFGVDTFQTFNKSLSTRLNEVLNTPTKGLLVCLPYPMIKSNVYRGYEKFFWEREWLWKKNLIKEALERHSVLGDSTFTRFYMHRRDIVDYPSYVQKLKRIWDNVPIVIVEGSKSRLGVGNDLFSNASDIKRIICPAVNAYSVYDQILSGIKEKGPKDCIYLLALGHTATVLAADLAQEGFRALDLGHIDIEYEWLRMGAKEKCPVKDKYVNEVQEGRIIGDAEVDQQYEKEIWLRIGSN